MNPLILLALGLAAIAAPAAGCSCGEENLKTRIINGREAQRGRWPWLVSLLSKVNGNSYASCGASLINDRYVLTAAHCLAGKPNPREIIAMLGAYDDRDRQIEGENQEKLEVESYVLHPNYDHEGEKMDDDIALIKLASPVDITSGKWNPVCLADFSDYDNLFIYGWGRQNQGRSLVSSKKLHVVDVDEVDNSTCTRQYWGYRFLPEKEICAGTQGGSCQGDSGGPLSTRKNGRVYQVGVVSFGTPGCGVEGQMKPDIYERVTAHLNWIKQNTQDGNWCKAPETPDFTHSKIAQPGAVTPKPKPTRPSYSRPSQPSFRFPSQSGQPTRVQIPGYPSFNIPAGSNVRVISTSQLPPDFLRKLGLAP